MEKFEPQENSYEKENRTYVYIDHSKPEEPIVIFEWTGKGGILAADEAYKNYTGKDVAQQSHIGCAIENPGQNID